MKSKHKLLLVAGIVIALSSVISHYIPTVNISLPTQFLDSVLVDNIKNSKNKRIESAGEFAQVSRVIDGDTVELSDGQVVRYIGIDAPETGKGYSQEEECFAQNATVRNQELVGGQKVRLVRDVSDTDKYGRLLRYVYAGNTFVNEALVAEGFATAKRYRPDTAQSDILFAAMRSAQKNDAGLWSACSK